MEKADGRILYWWSSSKTKEARFIREQRLHRSPNNALCNERARVSDIFYRIETLVRNIRFHRRGKKNPLIYIRTFCLSQISLGKNMSFALILGGKR